MILADQGVNIPEAFIREAAGVDADGAFLSDLPQAITNLSNMVEAPNLASFEFNNQQTIDQLQAALSNGSAIVSVSTDLTGGSHAVVVDRIEGGSVFVRDPLPVGIGTSQSIPIADFATFFTGNVVSRL